MRKAHFFILFALLLLALFGYKTYEQYQRIFKTQQLIIENESRSLARFVTAFRQTYQDAFLDNDIEINDKTIHLFPVKTTKEISERFSEAVNGKVQVRTVSDRPRNPQNHANAFEMKVMEYFRKHPELKEYFVKKENTYHYLQPLYIKESCLRCHGKREEALPAIRQKYDKAYGYKLGDLRGVLDIVVKEHSFFNVLYTDFRNTVLVSLFIYALFLIIIYLLFRQMYRKEERYTHDLETEIAHKTSEIQKQKDTFQTLFEKASDGILIVKEDRMLECNEQAVRLFGYPDKESLLHVSLAKLSPMYQPDGLTSKEKISEAIALAKEQKGHQFEWLSMKKSGETFFCEVTLTPVVLNDEDVLHVLIRDISEKKRAEKKLIEQKNFLHYQAHHDDLTGLPNRTLFNERLSQSMALCESQGNMLALFFIDLDHFKQINNTLGHHVGDEVLKVAAIRMREILRKRDTLARLGGDEFTIIIEEVDRVEQIRTLAEKILHAIIEPMHVEGHTLYISCSIGISIFPKDATDPENLIKYADAAMYRAKDEGRNNYQFYSREMTMQAFYRLITESSLHQAIEKQEFRLLYQPQLNGQTEELIGLEALIRWEHPDMGLLSPDRFIPLAEESDLIIEIDRWVMHTAMKQYVSWYAAGLNPGKLSLNLSMRQLGKEDFLEVLASYFDATGFKAEWLELEVTAGQVMKKPEENIEKLNYIHAMGISIAIDDFGTGYSSLAYLKRLPVSKLKIDQSFIREIPQNKDDDAIVRAIIALAQSLEIGIIAEGVETDAQRRFLIQHGCYNMQGYFYSRPVETEVIENDYLKKRKGS